MFDRAQPLHPDPRVPREPVPAAAAGDEDAARPELPPAATLTPVPWPAPPGAVTGPRPVPAGQAGQAEPPAPVTPAGPLPPPPPPHPPEPPAPPVATAVTAGPLDPAGRAPGGWAAVDTPRAAPVPGTAVTGRPGAGAATQDGAGRIGGGTAARIGIVPGTDHVTGYAAPGGTVAAAAHHAAAPWASPPGGPAPGAWTPTGTAPAPAGPDRPAAPRTPGRAAAGAGHPDPALVRLLRERAAERLHAADKADPDASAADREQRGRAVIAAVVAEWADVAARERGVSTSPEEDRALARAVFDWLFRAGPLERYLTDPDVENILVNGYDTVWVDYSDQARRRVPPLTTSDAELRELLRDLARRHGSGERTLSTASPTLALRLPDGSRLQAVTEVTPRTYVTIRRHRVRDVTLTDLVGLGTLDPLLADFLGALVRARKNIVVCGTQGVGKTSLLRALSHEIQPDERVGTFETELELFLHEIGHLRQVVPFEAREGNGERGADGRAAGELTIGELIPAALRMSLSRMIVGEVRSAEIVPMLRVMTNSEGGSMCTLHVREADMVFDRIAELCLEYGEHMSDSLAYRLAGNAIDYVVFIRMLDETGIGGRRHRFVSHVLEVAGMGEHLRPAVNTIFAPAGDDPRGVPRMHPTDLPDLVRAGLPPDILDRPPGWRPIDLIHRQYAAGSSLFPLGPAATSASRPRGW